MWFTQIQGCFKVRSFLISLFRNWDQNKCVLTKIFLRSPLNACIINVWYISWIYRDIYIWAKAISVTVFMIATAASGYPVTDWPSIALCQRPSQCRWFWNGMWRCDSDCEANIPAYNNNTLGWTLLLKTSQFWIILRGQWPKPGLIVMLTKIPCSYCFQFRSCAMNIKLQRL